MSTQADPVRNEYDRLAESYDRRWRPYLDASLRAVLDVLTPDSKHLVLDVACGTGELERLLQTRCSLLRLFGTDISEGMLRQAARKPLSNVSHWCQSEASRLPFADQQFDNVVCANSFHYFRSPASSLREMRRVLRAGGHLILIDWCDDYWLCKLCSSWLRWTDPAFYRTYSLQSCRSLLQDADLHVCAAERFRISWLWGLMRFVCQPTAAE